MKRTFTVALAFILTLCSLVSMAEPYILRYGMNGTQYQQLFDSLSPKGWVPQHIDIVNIDGKMHYAGVWLKEDNKTAWEARHNLTEKQYQEMMDYLTPKGYIPYSITVYQNEQSQTRYAAIWRKEPDIKFVARHNLTEPQYTKLLKEMEQEGLYIYTVAAYEEGGTAKFAAAWQPSYFVKKDQYIERHHISTTTSQQLFDELSPKGYIPLELIGYTVKGAINFALLWTNEMKIPWQVRHNLTPEQFQSYENMFKSQQYYLYRLKGYNNKGKINYIAGWISYKDQ